MVEKEGVRWRDSKGAWGVLVCYLLQATNHLPLPFPPTRHLFLLRTGLVTTKREPFMFPHMLPQLPTAKHGGAQIKQWPWSWHVLAYWNRLLDGVIQIYTFIFIHACLYLYPPRVVLGRRLSCPRSRRQDRSLAPGPRSLRMHRSRPDPYPRRRGRRSRPDDQTDP